MNKMTKSLTLTLLNLVIYLVVSMVLLGAMLPFTINKAQAKLTDVQTQFYDVGRLSYTSLHLDLKDTNLKVLAQPERLTGDWDGNYRANYSPVDPQDEDKKTLTKMAIIWFVCFFFGKFLNLLLDKVLGRVFGGLLASIAYVFIMLSTGHLIPEIAGLAILLWVFVYIRIFPIGNKDEEDKNDFGGGGASGNW